MNEQTMEVSVMNKGIVDLDIGGKVDSPLIEKYTGKVEVQDTMSILSTKIKAVYVHYDEDIGYFYDFQTVGVQLKIPKLYYIIPVYIYPAPHDPGHPLGAVKYLRLGEKTYQNQIVGLTQNLQGDIKGVKFLVSCKDAKYQNLLFQPIGNSDWQNSEEVKAYVASEWQRYNKMIDQSIARTIDEAEYIALKGLNVTPQVGAFAGAGIPQGIGFNNMMQAPQAVPGALPMANQTAPLPEAPQVPANPAPVAPEVPEVSQAVKPNPVPPVNPPAPPVNNPVVEQVVPQQSMGTAQNEPPVTVDADDVDDLFG